MNLGVFRMVLRYTYLVLYFTITLNNLRPAQQRSGNPMSSKSALAAVSFLVLPFLGGCNTGQANVPEAALPAGSAALPVEVVSPQVGEVLARYETTAKIASDAEAPVIARVEGQVVELLAEEGDRVVEGQILARLDGERLRLRMLQARANLDKTAREYERLKGLHARGLVSSAAFESLEFDLDSMRAGYELQRLQYEYTSIRAPISGVVASRDIKPGTHVRSGDATFRITDTSRLVAHLRIPQSELSKFSAGHAVELRVDAVPATSFIATIARISPTIDARNGTFRATAYIDNGAAELVPGMFGRFAIAYERRENVLLVPTAALVREDGISVVYVVENDAAVRRPVTLGIESDGMIEIVEGLARTERVVVAGQGGLRDGSRVLASHTTSGGASG